MTGGASFNEVFFNDVRVPDDHRLGEVNAGLVGRAHDPAQRAGVDRRRRSAAAWAASATPRRLIEMLRHFGLDQDAVFRDELARVYTGFQVAKWNNQRAMDKIKAGQAPGPELSGAKLSLTQNMQAVTEFVAKVLGPRLIGRHRRVGHVLVGQVRPRRAGACGSPAAPTRCSARSSASRCSASPRNPASTPPAPSRTSSRTECAVVAVRGPGPPDRHRRFRRRRRGASEPGAIRGSWPPSHRTFAEERRSCCWPPGTTLRRPFHTRWSMKTQLRRWMAVGP